MDFFSTQDNVSEKISIRVGFLLVLRLLLLPFPFLLSSEKIDLVCSFHFDELDPEWKIRCETFLEARSLTMGFGKYLTQFYADDIKKVICMQNGATPEELSLIPKEKLVLIIWEPGGEGESYCVLFDRVYTYNDLLVDGEKYRKFHYPVLKPMTSPLPDFSEKKLCAMVSHTWTEKRARLIRFFESCPEEDFDYFGFTPMIQTSRYRGPIPSHPVSQEKFDVLKHYRFCICFENSAIPGYITEKIFSCFASGCVPVYWGAPNIERYVPKGCFIDTRDFESDEALYRTLKGMGREEYEGYLERIRTFLKSDAAHLFSAERFNEMLVDLMSDPK